MAEPFLSEIRIFSFNFAPKGWAQCNGQLLPINQNQGLFSLLGTTFGGNGQTTFALPDLRQRVPIHVGNGHTLGERAGEAAHTVTISEMPTHTPILQGSNVNGDAPIPQDRLPAANVGAMRYRPPSNLVAMSTQSVTSLGGSQAHENMQPYLALMFCIALQGIFPSRN